MIGLSKMFVFCGDKAFLDRQLILTCAAWVGNAYERIYVQNGIVFYYGNPAGYLGDGKAVIDCMFQKEELVSFVKEQFLVEPYSGRVCMTGCRREVVSKRQRRSVSGKGGGLESINWDRTVQS